MTDKVKIFKNIFEGLDTAYGQTIKTDQFDERGKHKNVIKIMLKVQNQECF